MSDKFEIYNILKKEGLTPEQEEIIQKELNYEIKEIPETVILKPLTEKVNGFYDLDDLTYLQQLTPPERTAFSAIKTLDELLERDKQREQDGFPRRIRLGKYVKPTPGSQGKVVVVPTTTESKFYHDDSITEDEEENTGGSGEGEEGEIIGEQQAQPQQGEGEGQGAGEGGESDHDVVSEAFDLGKVLTEKFQLPNLKEKGKKRSMTKYVYDLTDRNRGFGQILDKKATLKQIVETNILLGRINPQKVFKGEDMLISPQDHIYRILSKEKDFDNQAIVFFLRDYSGSMHGEPSQVVSSQHLLIYSWLMFQYSKNVETRFIVHDTAAKEVPDFYTYYKSAVAGGTRVAPAFKLVNTIIQQENLAKDYNIYVFYGTDGDDWDSDGKELLAEIRQLLLSINRLGITVAKNSWTGTVLTTVEKNINYSGILKEKPDLIRLDSFKAKEASEDRIMESIKKLIS